MASNGKVALVTGADSDVGAAIVQRFAREGFQVAACGASRERAKPALEGAAAHGAAAEFFELDVRKESDAARFVQGAVDRFGRIDAIVNCGASRRIIGTIMDISDEDFDEEMAADLKSVLYVSRAAIPTIAKGGGGAIVNMSSIARAGVRGRALRSASKAALSALTRAMALDHGRDAIRVNAVLLGPTLSRDAHFPPEQLARMKAEAALGELHTAEDVAAAVYFFASDDARHITGALLPLDAGRSLASF